MSSVTVRPSFDVTLPPEACRRYGIAPATNLRVIETRSGILLVPLTGEPMDPALRAELEQWQALAGSAWEQFPYEE